MQADGAYMGLLGSFEQDGKRCTHQAMQLMHDSQRSHVVLWVVGDGQGLVDHRSGFRCRDAGQAV